MASHNSVADLADLIARLLPAEDDAGIRDLRVELRLGEADVPGEGWHITVSATRVFLQLETPGFDIEPRSRHGEPRREEPTVVRRSTVKSDETKLGGGLSALAAPLKAAASLAVGATRDTKNSLVEEGSEEIARYLVTAQSGNRWEIVEPLGKAPLKTTALDDDTLCRLKGTRGANRRAAILRVFIYPRDIHVTAHRIGDGAPVNLPPSKEKIIAIVMAKSLSRRFGSRKPGGPILLSHAELEDVG